MSEPPMQVGKRAVQLRDVEEGRGSAMMTMTGCNAGRTKSGPGLGRES